jgi:hypothetical protein
MFFAPCIVITLYNINQQNAPLLDSFTADLQHCLHRWHVNKLHFTCTYNPLPEDEPSGSKHAEDNVEIKIC